jgi:hypothetical protein
MFRSAHQHVCLLKLGPYMLLAVAVPVQLNLPSFFYALSLLT